MQHLYHSINILWNVACAKAKILHPPSIKVVTQAKKNKIIHQRFMVWPSSNLLHVLQSIASDLLTILGERVTSKFNPRHINLVF